MRTIEVARRAGCSAHQVHKLEAAGVLPEVPRTSSGYRTYDEAHVASVVAYQELVTAAGPARARTIMAAAHADGEEAQQRGQVRAPVASTPLGAHAPARG